ncbi:T9SS type A sorting domain-containing protein [bacterium]|nr:T9SS type A sorting domain-containing protein [bacterium]
MKLFLFIVVLGIILTPLALVASDIDGPQIDSTFVISDRIRNVIAVDDSPNQRFFAATFGLDNFDLTNPQIPRGKEAMLMRFAVENFEAFWRSKDRTFINMNENELCWASAQGTGDISSYNETDRININSFFNSTEAGQRIDGASGFWASPLLFKYESDIHDRLVLLNKSGTLFSINSNFLDGQAETYWHLNLRDLERSLNTSSYQLEYMATPTLVNNGKLYVLGLSSLFVVNAINGDIVQTVNFSGLDDDDYFIAPLTYDTSNDEQRIFYAISKQNKIFKINYNGSQTPLDPTVDNLDNCSTAPLVDNSGYIYFTGACAENISLNPGFDNLSQDNRSLVINEQLSHTENTNLVTSGYKGTILADRYNGLFYVNDNSIDYYLKEYNFDEFDGNLNYNPLTSMNIPNSTSELLGNVTTYINNHPALLERADLMKSIIVSIHNDTREQPPYYPTELEIMEEEDIKLCYTSTNQEYGNNTQEVNIASGPTCRTWAGITPYLTERGYMNVLYPDENGFLSSFPKSIPEGIGVGPAGEPGNGAESVNPPLGYSKFQKGKDNVIKYEIQPIFKVTGVSAGDPITFIYVNGYGKQSTPEITTQGDTVYVASFTNLLKDPSYTVTLITGNYTTGYSDVQYHNINIENGNITLDTDNILNVYQGDGLVTITDSSLYYDKIILHPNSQLKIGFGITLTANDLEICDGATLILGDDSNFIVNNATCNATENTAIIQVDVQGSKTGHFVVEESMNVSCESNLLFKGPNLSTPSYVFMNFEIHDNAETEFRSLNSLPSTNLSALINNFTNSGSLLINDCVRIKSSYDDYDESISSLLKIRDEQDSSVFGHLFLGPIDSLYTITINRKLFVGNDEINDPAYAQLTVDSVKVVFDGITTDDRYYHIYGIVNILGNGNCIMYADSFMDFKPSSQIHLKGNPDISQQGAQLKVLNGATVRFATGVNISGFKPDPDPNDQDVHGDRIITVGNGEILGTDPINSRKLVGLNILSTNPNNLRWEGLSINKDYGDENFELSNSQISGVDKIYVKYPGEETIISEVDFSNCKYGVFSDTSFENEQLYKILDCTFEDCDYGIYLEDKTPSDTTSSITAIITDCNFGNDDYISGFNRFGLALKSAENVSINGCNFYRNGYGIFNIQSTILVGGHYDEYNEIQSDSPNNFYNNEKAGIYFGQSTSTETESLVYQNTFSGDNSTQSVASGTGIWANESVVDIVDNDFSILDGHGMLIKSYSWNTFFNFHGFAENEFYNNKGCELIGDNASLSTSANGHNLFSDIEFPDNRFIPKDPLGDFESWDRYILASLTDGSLSRPADMTGNYFLQLPSNNQERFYPAFSSFRFDDPSQHPLEQIITTGMEQFYEGLFDQSIVTMKQAVEVYPDSSLTKLAIDYLYLATRASSEDYSNLRSYLDFKIPTETLATYIKKEEVKTKCFVKEEDYITAISRLQLILDNPETVADSIFALIDQAYCYMNLANQGSKALPDVSVKTPDFASYMDFLYDLSLFSEQNSFNNQLIPSVLNIESNYPNPFNPETTISYSIPKDGKVLVSVYNLKGQKVKQLLNDHVIAGRHKVIWDGRNSQGQYVSSGLYFVKIKHSNMHRLHKMMLMK